ncbi:MAG: hypothetical protein NZT61_01280 [Deltaproteobacteria bacterium]|nr:hypothetical protein [Deltaproteobacteria bacterium]MCX7952488.1 hypothetical protein [Deltaproteobacteria bacterium]
MERVYVNGHSANEGYDLQSKSWESIRNMFERLGHSAVSRDSDRAWQLLNSLVDELQKKVSARHGRVGEPVAEEAALLLIGGVLAGLFDRVKGDGSTVMQEAFQDGINAGQMWQSS